MYISKLRPCFEGSAFDGAVLFSLVGYPPSLHLEAERGAQGPIPDSELIDAFFCRKTDNNHEAK